VQQPFPCWIRSKLVSRVGKRATGVVLTSCPTGPFLISPIFFPNVTSLVTFRLDSVQTLNKIVDKAYRIEQDILKDGVPSGIGGETINEFPSGTPMTSIIISDRVHR